MKLPPILPLPVTTLGSPQGISNVWYREVEPQYLLTGLSSSHTKNRWSRFTDGKNAFEILYLAETPIVALFETQALFGYYGQQLANPFHTGVMLNVWVGPLNVVDLTDPVVQAMLETSAQELTGDWRGYQFRPASVKGALKQPGPPAETHRLGAYLFAQQNCQGFLTVSAQVPDRRILAVFPQRILTSSPSLVYRDPTGSTVLTIPASSAAQP